MATPSSPATARRWLAEQLRKLREDRGLTQKEAAQACHWSGAKLSYLETGQRQVVHDDLDKLLPLYDVPEAQQARFHQMVDIAQERSWWERFENLVGDWMPAYFGLEEGSARMRTFEPLCVPGILQTPAYAAAIMRGGARRRSPSEVERLVELRMARKKILTRDEAPTRLETIIDESVLTRSPRLPGSEGRDILVEQLDYLLEIASLPNVDLRILPVAGGLQSYSAGPFAILSFPDDQPDPVVYLEIRGGAVWLEDFEAVARFELSFEGLTEMALDPTSSLAKVREAKERQASID